MVSTRTLKYFALSILATGFASSSAVPPKDHKTRQYFAVESDLSTEELQTLHPSWTFEHDVRGLLNHYVFSTSLNTLKRRQDFSSSPGIISFEDLPSLKNRLFKRAPIPDAPTDSSMAPIKEAEDVLNIDDPLFEKQWHLINPSFPGNDVNVRPAWYENITGNGVVAAIVDDGLDYESPDLKDQFCEEGSWDFNDNTRLPKPRLVDDYHGTRCAGEIAAAKNNGFCGVGVAYNAKVSGIRILSGDLTAEDEAASLIYANDINDIYSCSWGPADDGVHLQGPTDLVKKAMVKGVGIDLVDVNQLKELDERTKGAFFRRTFTTEEQRQAEMCPDKYEYLATRFAAKEAVFKAVNGLLPVGSLDFRTIETLNEANGK